MISRCVRNNPVVEQTMKKLYSERDETGDVTFIVELESIRAHRCILATLSPKYKAQFYGVQPDTGDIHVNNVSAAAFKEFLQFFYLENIVLTKENIDEVLNLAKQSLVNGFVTECIDFVKEVTMATMDIDNVCWAYPLAILHDINELKLHCELQISADTRKLFASDEFINCDQDVLIRILKLDSFSCKETDVFDGCIAWAREMCQKSNLSTENAENLRTALGSAIAEIRFISMTVEEFAIIHSKFKGFFSADESNEIFCIIGKLKNFKSKRFNQMSRNIRL